MSKIKITLYSIIEMENPILPILYMALGKLDGGNKHMIVRNIVTETEGVNPEVSLVEVTDVTGKIYEMMVDKIATMPEEEKKTTKIVVIHPKEIEYTQEDGTVVIVPNKTIPGWVDPEISKFVVIDPDREGTLPAIGEGNLIDVVRSISGKYFDVTSDENGKNIKINLKQSDTM